MRILYRAALVALLTWLPLMPPAVRAQVPSEEELKELEQQLLQLEAKKRKEAETGRRRLQEEARKQAELEKQRAAEEEMRRQAEEQRLKEEEAARQRAAQSVQRIAVELTNPFSLYSAGGNLIDRFSETNSTEVSFASLSVAENFQTAKEAVCTLTKNNISSLLDEIIPRTRNP